MSKSLSLPTPKEKAIAVIGKSIRDAELKERTDRIKKWELEFYACLARLLRSFFKMNHDAFSKLGTPEQKELVELVYQRALPWDLATKFLFIPTCSIVPILGWVTLSCSMSESSLDDLKSFKFLRYYKKLKRAYKKDANYQSFVRSLIV